MVIELLTAILAFITAIYAYLTFRMALASEASVKAVIDQSNALLRPYITIAPFVRPHTNIIYLRVQNTGRTAAERVRLTFDKDFFQFGSKSNPDANLRTLAAFSEQMDSLPPGFELLFALAQGPTFFGADNAKSGSPVQFSITASYEFSGKRVEEVNRIDLRPFSHSEGERNPIVEELERIREHFKKQ